MNDFQFSILQSVMQMNFLLKFELSKWIYVSAEVEMNFMASQSREISQLRNLKIEIQFRGRIII